MEKIAVNLFPNKYKKSESHPDYTARKDGKDYAVWKKKDKNGNWFLSLSIQDEYKKEDKPTAVNGIPDDELPF